MFLLAAGLLILAPILSHGAQPAVGDNIVRVHLNSYGEPSSVTLNVTGSYKLETNNQPLSGTVTVAANGTGIRVTAGGNTYNLGGDIYIKAGSLAGSNLLQVNGGYRYAGDLRILNKSGKLKLVNHVDIETYVMGVLPYEVSNSWPIESLKAQAVAARTYAYFTMHSKVRTTVEQDLVNSTAHQVYYGYNSSYANCISAVNATKNTIMKTPGGQTVYACFSASNGGMTETGVASGAAATNFDYLPLKDDPYDLAYALNTTSYSGKVTVPKTLSAADLKTSTAQPYKMLREKLQASGVNTGSIAGDVEVKSIVLSNPKVSNPDRQFTGANFVLGIPGAGDVTLNFGPVTFSGSSTKYPFLSGILGLGNKFTMLALQDNGTNWIIASVRYGHGAGMSQVGAYQMAASGKTYHEILAFYYNVGTAASFVTMPWDVNSGTTPGAPGYTVTTVSKKGTVNTPGSTLNVRSGPGTGNDVVATLSHGAKVTINGQVADWWRVDLGNSKTGFVSSAFITLDPESQPPSTTDPPTTTEPPTTTNPPTTTDPPAGQTKTGKVNTPGTTLNVRSGAGTSYAVIGSLKHNDKITITGESSGWYKITYSGKTGYVSAAFVILDGTATQTPPAPQTKTVYVNTPGSSLNVRSGAGTSFAVIGTLKHGEKITVTDHNNDWYKLTYSGKTGYISKSFTQANAPAAQTPSAPAPASKTAYVNTPGSTLNVRSGPGTNSSIVGTLKHGEKITVTEENASWYKLTFNGKAGYVSRSFVSDSQPSASAPGTSTQKTGTVNSATGLNVRSGPGTNYSIVGGLSNGAKVTITGQSGSWYKIKYGTSEAWISSSFVK